ncbi:MAG: exodeoxyribonuclease III [Corynebacterium sp.]|nr:exodeoxyribonuclease III [Corynebacterium sp.]
MSLTIASVNVNGIRAACKQRSAENLGMNAWLNETAADVVLMQEVRANPQQTAEALAPALESGWYLAMSDATTPGAKGRAGVGILSRTPIDDVRVGFGSFMDAGRWIEANTAGIRVASLYLPSGSAGTAKQDEKYRFLDEFSPLLDQRAKEFPEMVIGGDWNICHRAQDLKNNRANEKKSGHLPEERAFMDHVFGVFPDSHAQPKKGLGEYFGAVEYSDLTNWEPNDKPVWFDATRRLLPESDGPYTWWTYRGQAFNNDAGWRIDYQAVTKDLLERAHRTWVEKAPSVETRWSDHSPLLVEYR